MSSSSAAPPPPHRPLPPHTIHLDEMLGGTENLAGLVKTEGFFEVRGCEVAYFKYSVPGNDNLPPVIAIHGGPAFCHNYCLPLKILAKSGHPVIFYDQNGCGKSSHQKSSLADIEQNAPFLLTIEYYVSELRALIKFFSLDSYYVFGSSWGTIVAQEFAVTQPSGLLGLILDGALSDANLYIKTQWRDRISTLPTYTQTILKKLIDARDFSNPMYQELNCRVGMHFTCRLIPFPDCYYDSVAGMNSTIYSKMQGDNEFMIGGVLTDWSITSRLNAVQCPVVVLAGEFDTMTVECSMAIVNAIPKARKLEIIPRAAHCKLIDEPFICVEVIERFLNDVESERAEKGGGGGNDA